jgi:hypothetical protein
MLFEINESIYLNGNIITNRFPRGDIGINDIKNIVANNIKGIIFSIELPSLINQGQYLYTVKIFDYLYALNVKQTQISNIPASINGIYNFSSNSNLIQLNSQLSNQFNKMNNLNEYTRKNNLNEYDRMNNLDKYDRMNNLDQFNKLNFINSQINAQNSFNQNLNNNNNIQKTFTKYIYYKLIDEWLYEKLIPILAFVEIVNSKAQLIKSMNKYSIEKLDLASDEEIEIRVEYLENKIITKKLVRLVLKKIVKKMCLNWYELNKYEKTIKKVFFEYLKDLLKESINSI